MDLLIYLGKVNVYWILFYVCYWLLFRKHTFFVWNRFYLLGSLMISFALPFIHFPDNARVIPTAVYAVSTIPVYVSRPESTKIITHWTQFVWAIQIIGCGLMLFKLLEAFKNLFKLINQGETIPLEDHTLVLLPHNEIGSFSFLKWLVVNFTDYELNFDPILRHESVHIRQLHSLDILLIEILKVGFWFNPVLWFYKKSLQEVHEYLADEEVPNREQYARFLVAYALNAPIASLTNHFFNSSLLKSRIQMIYKNRNSQWALGKYLMIFPIIGMVVMLTAARERLLTAIERNNFKVLSTREISVSGIVSDENGQAIESASVIVKGKTAGTLTDMYGKFEISDVYIKDSLVISHINYETIIVDVKNPELDFIILKKKENTLGKIVVTPDHSNESGSNSSSVPVSGNTEMSVIEQMPQFPGGETELSQFLSKNVVYPSEAASEGVEGDVKVSFTINDKGYIRNPKIIEKMGYGLDEEALRVVLKMPRWQPGKQGGRAIAVQYNLNISFAMKADREKFPENIISTDKTSGATQNYQSDKTISGQNIDLGLNPKNYSAGKITKQAANMETAMYGVVMNLDKGKPNYKSTGSIFPKEYHIAVDGKVSKDPDVLKKINPDDIQSISVFKNESRLYVNSPNGKNDIIIITKKKK
ncbi:TonB family protein [Dyadobacter subterraneus]|uniref:TonB family protein n=1 Tax=Dyadobacter subterraneus TaxID=2773304 RepID=A0ABR9WPR7_9BACT|nr:M56 family metallopeptidase [Dyadobacter subterraneus]MBE9466356.1 TonB family protein [Dyadobacter subterraneus]